MSDKRRFSALMDDLGIVYDKTVTADLKRLYWDDLCRMPIAMIEDAMRAHRRDPDRGRFFPRPADIIAQCNGAHDAHPGADEAWSICLESLDEQSSVVITDQILEARAAAHPVYAAGDQIGARMAFRAAYERIVRAAPAMPQWRFSAGHDPARRADAAERAIRNGLLPRDSVARYLPAPEPTQAGRAIAGLITGNVVAHPASGTDAGRARLAEVRAMLKAEQQRAEAEQAARDAQHEAELQSRQVERHGERTDEERQANLAAALKRAGGAGA